MEPYTSTRTKTTVSSGMNCVNISETYTYSRPIQILEYATKSGGTTTKYIVGIDTFPHVAVSAGWRQNADSPDQTFIIKFALSDNNKTLTITGGNYYTSYYLWNISVYY